ncbi:TPA: hypothetical protein ACNBK4_004994, partial [Escherichia coli]
TAEASDNVDDRYGLLSDITEIKSEQYNEYFPLLRENNYEGKTFNIGYFTVRSCYGNWILL